LGENKNDMRLHTHNAADTPLHINHSLQVCLAVIALSLLSCHKQSVESVAIKRATLDNGLRVVVVRNALAHVATVYLNYMAGGDETPSGFPGTAHAQEHMLFRGCTGITADQTSAVFAQLGGDGDADTEQNITQYFSTVPAQDLDVALRLYAGCMQKADDDQGQWDQERGAIEQEVARDLSNPTYNFLTRLNQDLFAGTPYSTDALGTKASFDATTGKMLADFYDKWYGPNNAILVVVGDVDPDTTLASIKTIYGPIPKRAIGEHPKIELQPVKAESFTIDSNLPYTLAFLAYRFPGTDSPDYAAARILADALASQRGDLYALVPQGKALAAEFGLAESYPKASVGYALGALPANADSASILTEMRQIIANYLKNGVPADLVEAAKRSEIAGDEFQRDSIPGLASLWSEALAGEGRQSPDEDVDAIKKVTPDDVNRVARAYLVDTQAIAATLKPRPSGAPVAAKGFGGGETLTAAPTKPVELPEWAKATLNSLAVPKPGIQPADMTLANGIRLIVVSVGVAPTVMVTASIRHEADLEAPPGKEGVSDVTEELFNYGTKNLDRIAFQKALDDIGASESGGADFSVHVLKQYFSRGVELLADNELNPAFPADAFNVVRQQTAEFTAGNLASPEYRAGRALDAGLYPKGDPELREATPKTVGGLSLDDVHNYYASTFRPDLTTVVVIGDVTAEEAKATIEKWFGNWKATGAKPETVLPPVPPNHASATNVPDPSSVQDSVQLAEEVGLNRTNPDYYPLQVGNFVLGGGFYATRLYHDLRQVAGYVYNVENQLSATQTRGTYTVEYGCDPANVSKARALIQRDLLAMQAENVTPGELQQAKALLLRQIPLGESSEDAIAGALLRRARLDVPLDEPFRAAERYFNMTADEVRAAFMKWIRPNDFVQVVRGPAPK
jgi:zinc protease